MRQLIFVVVKCRCKRIIFYVMSCFFVNLINEMEYQDLVDFLNAGGGTLNILQYLKAITS